MQIKIKYISIICIIDGFRDGSDSSLILHDTVCMLNNLDRIRNHIAYLRYIICTFNDWNSFRLVRTVRSYLPV